MTTPTPSTPGWYPVPDEPDAIRYWNGREWDSRKRPPDAMNLDTFTDAKGDTVLLTIPDSADTPIAVAVIEGGNMADPAELVVLWPDQAIALGQALVRAGIRKQVIAERESAD